MTAATLLEELRSHGITLSRSASGGIVAKPKAALTDAIRLRLRSVREEIEALIPPLETIDEHWPAYIQRPCVSPRRHTDWTCASYKAEDLTGSSSIFAARVKREAKGCGDCDIAHAAMEGLQAYLKRKKKLARQIAREKANAKYRENIPLCDVDDEEDPEPDPVEEENLDDTEIPSETD